MAGTITVQPEALWNYYQFRSDKLGSTMFEIGKNPDFGIYIYLTEDDDGAPCVRVELDDSEIESEIFIDRFSAVSVSRKLYEKYLTDNVSSVLAEVEPIDDDEFLEELGNIDDREDELNDAIYDFIQAVAPEIAGELDADALGEVLTDCKEHFLEYLARKHKFNIYRPMVLEDEDGEDFYEEYPYDCMEFDDEDNPIYQP